MFSVPWVSLAKNRGLVRRQLQRQQAPGKFYPAQQAEPQGGNCLLGWPRQTAVPALCAVRTRLPVLRGPQV